VGDATAIPLHRLGKTFGVTEETVETVLQPRGHATLHGTIEFDGDLRARVRGEERHNSTRHATLCLPAPEDSAVLRQPLRRGSCLLPKEWLPEAYGKANLLSFAEP
jgi:hypothetical protein